MVRVLLVAAEWISVTFIQAGTGGICSDHSRSDDCWCWKWNITQEKIINWENLTEKVLIIINIVVIKNLSVKLMHICCGDRSYKAVTVSISTKYVYISIW